MPCVGFIHPVVALRDEEDRVRGMALVRDVGDPDVLSAQKGRWTAWKGRDACLRLLSPFSPVL